jgi:hypothetical protein
MVAQVSVSSLLTMGVLETVGVFQMRRGSPLEATPVRKPPDTVLEETFVVDVGALAAEPKPMV